MLYKLLAAKNLEETCFFISESGDKEYLLEQFILLNKYNPFIEYEKLLQKIDDEIFKDEIYKFHISNNQKNYCDVCDDYVKLIYEELSEKYEESELELIAMYLMLKLLKDRN